MEEGKNNAPSPATQPDSQNSQQPKRQHGNYFNLYYKKRFAIVIQNGKFECVRLASGEAAPGGDARNGGSHSGSDSLPNEQSDGESSSNAAAHPRADTQRNEVCAHVADSVSAAHFDATVRMSATHSSKEVQVRCTLRGNELVISRAEGCAESATSNGAALGRESVERLLVGTLTHVHAEVTTAQAKHAVHFTVGSGAMYGGDYTLYVHRGGAAGGGSGDGGVVGHSRSDALRLFHATVAAPVGGAGAAGDGRGVAVEVVGRVQQLRQKRKRLAAQAQSAGQPQGEGEHDADTPVDHAGAGAGGHVHSMATIRLLHPTSDGGGSRNRATSRSGSSCRLTASELLSFCRVQNQVSRL